MSNSIASNPSAHMTVQVRYFAILREQRGLASETITTASRDAESLYGELQRRFHFTLSAEHVRVAINGEFAPWSTALAKGMEVVFLPPVAGG